MISCVICSRDNARFSQIAANIGQVMGEENEIVRVVDALSICEGYTRGLAHCRGDVVVFCHDDIEFLEGNLGKRLRGHLEKCEVVGVAGTTRLLSADWASAGIPYIFGQVTHGNPQMGFDVCIYGLTARLVQRAQALDGLFFACKRSVAERVGFDAVTFDGFHGYDVDFTFRAHLAGFRVAVAGDVPVIHSSGGRYDDKWQRYADAFMRKHAGKLAVGVPIPFRHAIARVATKAQVLEVMRAPWNMACD